MEGIFLEFENENALRSYPFASACVQPDGPDGPDAGVPADVFIDAALYPVNPSGVLYLSSVSEEGLFTVSDGTGAKMTGSADGSVVELYDLTPLHRHAGTLVASSAEALGEFAGQGALREYDVSRTAFASSCVFPVVVDGVSTISVSGGDPVAGRLEFSNGRSDDIRVSSGIGADGRKTLRFDVLPRMDVDKEESIRRIICVVDGQTPFRIAKLSRNTILVMLDGIDKEAVCAAAHREDGFTATDTCSCNGPCRKDYPSQTAVPGTYQLLEVFIPGQADNAFYLATPNLVGYTNPISITMEDGVVSPKVTPPKVVVDGYNADLADGEMLDAVTSKGVVIQVPGLSGGEV